MNDGEFGRRGKVSEGGRCCFFLAVNDTDDDLSTRRPRAPRLPKALEGITTTKRTREELFRLLGQTHFFRARGAAELHGGRASVTAARCAKERYDFDAWQIFSRLSSFNVMRWKTLSPPTPCGRVHSAVCPASRRCPPSHPFR